jgi:hypothetical protein
LNALELRHLKRFCTANGLDFAEIDSSITYSENKKHLRSLVPKRLEDLGGEGESQLEDYLDNHFLSHYLSLIADGSANVEHVPVPQEPKAFSLRAWVNL